MKYKCFLLLMAAFLMRQPSVFAQDTITAEKTKAILYYLASDSLKGRGNARPELLTAGRYIMHHYSEAGLVPFSMQPSFALPFRPFGGRRLDATETLLWNGKQIQPDFFAFYNPEPGRFSPLGLNDMQVVEIDSFFRSNTLLQAPVTDKPLLIWSRQDVSNVSQKNLFDAIDISLRPLRQPVLLVYAGAAPASMLLQPVTDYYNDMLQYNIIGMLPGKSKAEEAIIFSAHYDHMGVHQRKREKDSILNGANDNASGVTALLQLADYYARRNDNERTLIFCAFSGEELGLLGSSDFVRYLITDKIVANINLEMLGVPQHGKKRLFITGFRHSSLPEILESGLKKAGVKMMREPDEEKLLFERSDNFPFVQKGIPAHTIMASDDDDECYHLPCDEVNRIDIEHLNFVIKAIAQAAIPLIQGEETPTRIRGRF